MAFSSGNPVEKKEIKKSLQNINISCMFFFRHGKDDYCENSKKN